MNRTVILEWPNLLAVCNKWSISFQMQNKKIENQEKLLAIAVFIIIFFFVYKQTFITTNIYLDQLDFR